MSILSPPTNQLYPTLSYFLRQANKHSGSQGYTMVLKRTKKSPERTTRKAWITCNGGKKIQIPTGQEKHHTSSQHIECCFSIIAEVEKSRTDGGMEIKDLFHSYGLNEPGAHLVLRQMARTFEAPSKISRQLIVYTAPSQIPFAL